MNNTLPKTSKGGSFYAFQDGHIFKARLKCGTGYISPQRNLAKLINNVWDPPELNCLPVSELLVLPQTGDGGRVTSNSNAPYHYHDEAELHCKIGYIRPNIYTSKVVVENNILKWEPSSLNCIPVECDPPPDIANGKFDPLKAVYIFQDEIQFNCSPGYALQTVFGLRLCGVKGFWEPPIMKEKIKCLPDRKWCPIVKTPLNGSVQLSNGLSYESVASFACNKGYVLHGGKRKCTEDRTWSGTEPYCKPSKVLFSRSNSLSQKKTNSFISYIIWILLAIFCGILIFLISPICNTSLKVQT